MTEISVMFEGGAMRRFPVGTTAGDALREQAEADGGSKAVKRADRGARRERAGRGGGRPVAAAAGRLQGHAVAPESADGLEVIRHSDRAPDGAGREAALPQVEITIGPVIDNGFYYDFKRPEGFAPEDLVRIEETMRKIVGEDLPVRREELPRGEAVSSSADGRALQGRDHRGPAGGHGVALPAGRVRRPVPRSARTRPPAASPPSA
jgi:threonyl-tRNA synthetase